MPKSISFPQSGSFYQIKTYDGTLSGDVKGNSVINLFTTSSSVDDYVAFSFTQTCYQIDFTLSSGLAGSDIVLEWEYGYSDASNVSSWQPLTILEDTTNGLTQTGHVRFEPYYSCTDSGAAPFNIGMSAYDQIRVRLVSFTSITSDAITSAVFTIDTAVVDVDGTTDIDLYLFSEIYDWMNTNHSEWAGTKDGLSFKCPFTVNFSGEYVRLDDNSDIIIGNGSRRTTMYLGNLKAGYLNSGGKAYDGARLSIRNNSRSHVVVSFDDDTDINGSTIDTYDYWFRENGVGRLISGQNRSGLSAFDKGTFSESKLMSISTGYVQTSVFNNVEFLIYEWIMAVGSPTFNGVTIQNEDKNFNQFLTYNISFDLIDSQVINQNRILFLYQTYYNDLVFNVVSYKGGIPDILSGTFVTRHQGSNAFVDIPIVLSYDGVTYTDVTASFQAGTGSLSGNVGDKFYFGNLQTSSSWQNGLTNLNITVNTANVGYSYEVRLYDTGSTFNADKHKYDQTDNFTQSGTYYISMDSFGINGETVHRSASATTINGTNSFWLEVEITAQGTTAPVIKLESRNAPGGGLLIF